MRISLEECRRLGVPKEGRPWLIIQNNKVDDSKYIIVCHLTDQRRDDGSLKPLLDTDVPITKQDVPELKKDSYIRCSQLHSVEADSVEYFATIPPVFMLMVDKNLAFCLGFEERMGIIPSPETPAMALFPKKQAFAGHNLKPVKVLSGGKPKRNKKKKR